MPLTPQDDPQRAFRAGIFGLPFTGGGSRRLGLAEDASLGPGEAVILAMPRLAGLGDPRGAFETGRALRLIAGLFDKVGAPKRVVEQFRDDLAGAVITQRLRRDGTSWGLNETVDMFLEMYRHIFEGDEAELGLIGGYIRDRAAFDAAPKAVPADAGAEAGQTPFRHAA